MKRQKDEEKVKHRDQYKVPAHLKNEQKSS